MTVLETKEGRVIDYPDEAIELANYISFLVDATDDSLKRMKGSASFPQDGSRLHTLAAHFKNEYDDKVIEAVMTLLRRKPIPFYNGVDQTELNQFDPKSY